MLHLQNAGRQRGGLPQPAGADDFFHEIGGPRRKIARRPNLGQQLGGAHVPVRGRAPRRKLANPDGAAKGERARGARGGQSEEGKSAGRGGQGGGGQVRRGAGGGGGGEDGGGGQGRGGGGGDGGACVSLGVVWRPDVVA